MGEKKREKREEEEGGERRGGEGRGEREESEGRRGREEGMGRRERGGHKPAPFNASITSPVQYHKLGNQALCVQMSKSLKDITYTIHHNNLL